MFRNFSTGLWLTVLHQHSQSAQLLLLLPQQLFDQVEGFASTQKLSRNSVPFNHCRFVTVAPCLVSGKRRKKYRNKAAQEDELLQKQSQSQEPFNETLARSATKTLVWKILSVVVTLQTTLWFTGKWHDAVKMVVLSFLPTFMILFVLDRLVNRGVQQGGVSSKLQRSLIKVAVWRTCSMAANFVLAVLGLRLSLAQALRIVTAELVQKSLISFVYESIWTHHIAWGHQEATSCSREMKEAL